MSVRASLVRIRFPLVAAAAASLVRAADPVVLSGINDGGINREFHAFELYGSFPGREAIRPRSGATRTSWNQR